MKAAAWITLAVTLWCVLIAVPIYRHLHQTRRTARVVSGPHVGREGAVVSLAPFDLWITINTAATWEEKRAFLESKLESGIRDFAWLNETTANLRSWITVPRWRAEIALRDANP